ncbi:FMN-dependent NADH-azoreductase [Tenacibaculum sp. 190524A05c]|uniref:FMN-dependent NADH-azoreductase n=1 Tax=Tenacibaculum platacis TaxID=3137852 RepID=UPI0031FA774A
MKTLLRIDSSFNSDRSFSRMMADYYVKCWEKENPNGRVFYRDLDTEVILPLTSKTYAAFYNGENSEGCLGVSDSLIDELYSVDEILISSPVFNHSIPSNLKAYIDQIVRINRTFEYDEETGDRRGLLTGKKASIIVSRGGKDNSDGVEMYLSGILDYMGVSEVDEFSISGTAYKDVDERVVDVKKRIETKFDKVPL